jgi:hypothetical protein
MPLTRRTTWRDTLCGRAMELEKLNRHGEAIADLKQAIQLTEGDQSLRGQRDREEFKRLLADLEAKKK